MKLNHSSEKSIKKEIAMIKKDILASHDTLIGYPLNLDLHYAALMPLLTIETNNVGDPWVRSEYIRIDTKKYEKQVLSFFANLYKLPPKECWGYMTNGGTEGNMYGLFLARELYPNGHLYFSADTHYSIAKIARVLKIPHTVVPSQKNGELDYKALERLLKNRREVPIFNLNLGTTMKGAIDDLFKVKDILRRNKIRKYYLHIDAALFGMMVPFIQNAPHYTFKDGIHSIAISIHKFMGCPFPCGVVLTTRKNIKKISKKIEYVDTIDNTIPGSRNGHYALFAWYAIKTRGRAGFSKESMKCIANAQYLYNELKKRDFNPLLQSYSNIVMFDAPKTKVAKKWQLAPHKGKVHIVVMQHVTRNKLREFLKDLDR